MASTQAWLWRTVLPVLVLGFQLHAVHAAAQQTPAAGAENSCVFAHDGECDETNGACAPGTDSADCRPGAAPARTPAPVVPAAPAPSVAPAAGPNGDNCPFAKDGECDEPGIGSGACAAGTDTIDCKAHPGVSPQTPMSPAEPKADGDDNSLWVPAPAQAAPAAGGDDSCQFAKDQECDDPDGGSGLCAPDTDVTDCSANTKPDAIPVSPATPTPPTGSNKTPAGSADACEFANDSECDEPGKGTGLCQAGTDTTDCSAAAGRTPDRRPPPASTGGTGAAVPAACPFTKDGDCDEPGKGTGLCAAGTDVDDCRGK